MVDRSRPSWTNSATPTSVRVMERRDPTNISQGGSQRGSQSIRKTGQNEFKNAFMTSDGIRKHTRVLTVIQSSAQWRMPASFQAHRNTLPPTEVRPETTFGIDQLADRDLLRVARSSSEPFDRNETARQMARRVGQRRRRGSTRS